MANQPTNQPTNRMLLLRRGQAVSVSSSRAVCVATWVAGPEYSLVFTPSILVGVAFPSAPPSLNERISPPPPCCWERMDGAFCVTKHTHARTHTHSFALPDDQTNLPNLGQRRTGSEERRRRRRTIRQQQRTSKGRPTRDNLHTTTTCLLYTSDAADE